MQYRIWGAATAAALALTGFAAGGAAAQTSAPAAAGQQAPQALEKTITKVIKAGYLLYLPKGYGTEAGKKWPLVVFLHGSGESGGDLEKVKVHGPPKLVAAGKEFPFILVSPQAPEARRGWDAEVLNTLLDDVMAKYAVDADRVYLTGLSMGGYGTWAWATSNPERFAAIAPICGGGQARMAARRLKETPIWVFHGAQDPVVPLSQSQEMVDALKAAGAAQVKFTVYPEAKHDSWTAAYDDPALYDWLLSHQRKPAPPPQTTPAR